MSGKIIVEKPVHEEPLFAVRYRFVPLDAQAQGEDCEPVTRSRLDRYPTVEPRTPTQYELPNVRSTAPEYVTVEVPELDCDSEPTSEPTEPLLSA
jgi:hypothetical protein